MVEVLSKNRNYLWRTFRGGTFFIFIFFQIKACHLPKWTGFKLSNIFADALRGAKSKLVIQQNQCGSRARDLSCPLPLIGQSDNSGAHQGLLAPDNGSKFVSHAGLMTCVASVFTSLCRNCRRIVYAPGEEKECCKALTVFCLSAISNPVSTIHLPALILFYLYSKSQFPLP